MDIKFSETCQITGLDNIYKQYGFDNQKGLFVEIGGFDGETHSNTSGLADAGWAGVYVEPIKEYADKCIERHKNNNVDTINVAAGAKTGQMAIQVAGELSTSVNNPRTMYESAGLIDLYDGENLHETRIVPVLMLNTIMKMSGVPNGLDLLVLDCEGKEWDVLREFSIDIWKPEMVIIELHEQSLEWQAIKDIKKDTKAINDYMTEYKYTKIHSDEINTIFVRHVV